MIPELHFEGGRLLAVPAIHFRGVFAEAVHRTCLADATRPAAVAVELGQGAVDAVVQWMRELGVGSLVSVPLPCMLGLTRANHRIHPKYRAAALRLQEIHGTPLRELPPALLRGQLGFSPATLLCLSATDSIIEAIRSAVELNLPVYGVDLEDCASGDRDGDLVEDPALAGNDLQRWVERNGSGAGGGRDVWVDGRREQAMAARLKLLLRRHSTVLFTGGLGHWTSLLSRLRDTAEPAASVLPAGRPEDYSRVIVDPAIAIRQMDLFPDFTLRYESLRNLPIEDRRRREPPREVFAQRIRTAFDCAEPAERARVTDLAQYLSHLCLLNQRPTPDLIAMLNAAESMVSSEYAVRLGEALVRAALPWMKPENSPDLPRLLPAPLTPDERAFIGNGQKAEWVHRGRRSRPFFLDRGWPDTLPPLSVPLPAGECEAPPAGSEGLRTDFDWVWPPCEHLFFGTSYEAASLARENAAVRLAEPFAGSLQEGLDTRATLRAYARGDDRCHVRTSRPPNRKKLREALSEPVVYLFAGHEEARDAAWRLLQAGTNLERFTQDRRRHREIVAREGDMFVSSVQVSESRTPEAHLRPWVGRIRLLWGAVAFGNPCVNARQGARWLEEGNYDCGPILRWGGIEELSRYYQQRHAITLDLGDWHSSLIRIGLPYARERVVVVAPDSFCPSVALRREAAVRRIELAVLPLSHFAADRIAAIRRQIFVHTREDGLEFPTELNAVLGQPADAHFGLLPDWIRAQLKPTQ